MSRNGAGTYNLPAGNPVVPATVISTSWANTTLSDIATALTGSVAADGQTPITGNLQMSSNLITGLGNGVSAQDAVTLSQLNAVNSVITGSIQMWPTASAPTGYLLCAGSAVSRTTYAALFAVIGTTFGVGDGSTTFNLPNYTNKFPYGTTLGATGGSADAVVVSHTHTATVTDPSHSHTYSGANNIGQGGSGVNVLDGSNTHYTAAASTGISVSNSTTGVSGTNANLPPYLGINFIIKV